MDLLKAACTSNAEYGTKIQGYEDAAMAIHQLRTSIATLRTVYGELLKVQSTEPSLLSQLQTMLAENLKDTLQQAWTEAFNKWTNAVRGQALVEHDFEKRRLNLPDKGSWDHYKNIATPRLMKSTQRNIPPDMDLSHTEVFDWLGGNALWAGSIFRDNYSKWKEFVRDIPKAAIQDGKVVNSDSDKGTQLLRNWWSEISFLKHRWPQLDWSIFLAVMGYSAWQRGLCKTLIGLWDDENTQQNNVAAFTDLYNCFFNSISKIGDLKQNFNAVKLRFQELESVLTNVEVASQDVEGTLMAGDAAAARFDLERLQSALMQLQKWREGLSSMTYRDLDRVYPGSVERNASGQLKGWGAPSPGRRTLCGLVHLKLGNRADLRLHGAIDATKGPYFEPLGDTDFDLSVSSFLTLPAKHMSGIEFGEVSGAQMKQPDPQGDDELWTSVIEFATPFSKIPKVACWITAFECDQGKDSYLFLVEAEDVTTTQFTLAYRSAWSATSAQRGAAWVAHDPDDRRIFATDDATDTFPHHKLNEPYEGMSVFFKGKFDTPPAIMPVFHYISMNGKSPIKVNLEVRYLTKDGVHVIPKWEDDTKVQKLGFNLVAISGA